MVSVVLLTFAVFLPAASYPFLNWDDPINFKDNAALHGDIFSVIRWSWSTTLLGVYQPVSWMFAGLVCVVDGGAEPRTLHLANVLIHALSAGVYCVLMARLLRVARPTAGAAVWPIAAIAALCFACHPLRVETVAWATAQPYTLCVLFSLLTVLTYVLAIDPGRSIHARNALLLTSFVFCATAMLSKAAAMALPVVLVALDAWPFRRLNRPLRLLIEKQPFIVLAIGAGVLALWASGSVESIRTDQTISVLDRSAQSAYGLAFGVVKTAVPVELSPYYALPRAINPFEFRFVAAAALVVGLTIISVVLRRRAPALLAAWVCYVAIMLPSVGIVSHGLQLAADRYTYLSCIGWPAVIAGGLMMVTQSPSRKTRAAALAAAAMACAALVALTSRQLQHWRSSEVLWRHAIACAPDDAFAHRALARDLATHGDRTAAIESYRRAAELDPDHAETWYDLGYQLAAGGRLDDAVRSYREALARRRDYADARFHLGVALKLLGRLDEAVQEYALALEIRPDHAMTYNNLGNVYYAQARWADAERAYRTAAALDSDYAEPRNGLGLVMLKLGRPAAAITQFERALTIRPDYAEAKHNAAYARSRATQTP